MSSDKEQLIEMGFTIVRVDKALRFTDNKGLQPALDWLCAHQDDGDIDEPIVEESINKESTVEMPINIPSAKSLRCDDCGKLFASDVLVQLHSTKSGHINFSESVEEIIPLTEEEKRIQMNKLQEKMKQKREEREKIEEEENLKRERVRRQQGKTIIDSKTKFEEDEIKRLAEQKRKEKEDDKLYRQKLKDEIARDRESRKQISQPQNTECVPSKPLELKPNVGDFNTCRIQIRSQSGQPLVETFSAHDQLSKVVRTYAEKTSMVEYQHIQFRTTMPPKLYGEESMNMSLKELGFCPSIVLMVIVQPQ